MNGYIIPGRTEIREYRKFLFERHFTRNNFELEIKAAVESSLGNNWDAWEKTKVFEHLIKSCAISNHPENFLKIMNDLPMTEARQKIQLMAQYYFQGIQPNMTLSSCLQPTFTPNLSPTRSVAHSMTTSTLAFAPMGPGRITPDSPEYRESLFEWHFMRHGFFLAVESSLEQIMHIDNSISKERIEDFASLIKASVIADNRALFNQIMDGLSLTEARAKIQVMAQFYFLQVDFDKLGKGLQDSSISNQEAPLTRVITPIPVAFSTKMLSKRLPATAPQTDIIRERNPLYVHSYIHDTKYVNLITGIYTNYKVNAKYFDLNLFSIFLKCKDDIEVDVEIHKKSSNGKYNTKNCLFKCDPKFIVREKTDQLTKLIIKQHVVTLSGLIHCSAKGLVKAIDDKSIKKYRVLWVCFRDVERSKISSKVMLMPERSWHEGAAVLKRYINNKKLDAFLNDLNLPVFEDNARGVKKRKNDAIDAPSKRRKGGSGQVL